MIKKVFITISLLIVMLIAALALAPVIFKDQIDALVKQTINDQVEAEVDYSELGLSLFADFPNLQATLSDLIVVGTEDFEGDTLVQMRAFSGSIDLKSLWKGTDVQVNALHFVEPRLKLIVTESGKANWEITASSDETTAEDTTAFNLSLESVEIEGMKLAYADLKSGDLMLIDELNFLGTGDFSASQFLASIKTDAASVTYESSGVNYLNKIALELDADIEVDQSTFSYKLKENRLKLNALELKSSGQAQMTPMGDFDVDFSFETNENSLKQLLSLIPATYMRDYEQINASGDMQLSGKIDGIVSESALPAFEIDLNVSNGAFKYPDMQAGLKKLGLQTQITNEGGSADATVIRVSNFRADLEGKPVLLDLTLKNPFTDQYIKGELQAGLNLKSLHQLVPIDGVDEISGDADLDVRFDARMSDISNERYSRVNMDGNLTATDVQLKGSIAPVPLEIEELAMTFSPAKADITSLKMKGGESDFNIAGFIGNPLPYLIGEGELDGRLNVVSQRLNLTELLGDNGGTESNSSQDSSSLELPDDIAFDLITDFKTVEYDGMELKNVKGQTKLKDQALALNLNIADLLGGNAGLTGNFKTAENGRPMIDFGYDLSKLDIGQTAQTVTSAEKLAPVIRYITGVFNSKMNLSAQLTDDYQLDLNTLDGKADINIPFAKVEQLPIIEAIKEKTQLIQLKDWSIKNVLAKMKFDDGRANVAPFDLDFQDIKMNVRGSSGFDQSIDYKVKLRVPSDKLGNARSVVDGFLAKNPIPGFDVGFPEYITMNLDVKGSMKKPIVTIAQLTAGGRQEVKDEIKEQINEQIDDLKQEAKDQLDEQKEQLKEELQNQSEDIKEELRDNFEETKEDLKEDVKDRFRGLFGKPK